MTSKIQLLSEQTIDKIAAGEVIENPASVIKELVENSVDAGARRIAIEVYSGGFQKIIVTDDGMGMTREDALLCLKRHATSKIVDAGDLFSLITMGFRGEALASIAAISKMSLATAQEGSEAVVIEVEGGKIDKVSPHAHGRGTTIEVRSLFYNVPARKTFQKSTAACSAEITKVVTQLALAHPEIGFELVQQHRQMFSLPSASAEESEIDLLKRRAEVLLGKEFLQACHPLKMEDGPYKIVGLVGDPSYTRMNRSGQYLFVNRRPVSCPAIAYAVKDAYGTRLSEGKHPVYLLHVSISPELVDVNVHPQKKEVRLREESMVRYALHAAIDQALGVAKPVFVASESAFSYPDFSQPLVFKEEAAIEVPREEELFSEVQPVGMYGRYLIVDAKSCPSLLEGQGVVWFDLAAIEARLHFDALMQSSQQPPLSQGLLIPLTLSFSRAEAQLLNSHLELVQELGIQIRELGQTVFIVEAVPPFLEEGQVKAALEEIHAELQGIEREKLLKDEKKRRLASSLMRRVRSDRKSYHLTQALHLVKQLFKAKDPLRCPQGKRIFFHITEKEIEDKFV